MNDFDVIADAYEEAMNEGDYTTALAIQTGMNQAAVDFAAQQAFEAGVQAAQQETQVPQAGRNAAYSQFLGDTQEIDARNREVARSVKDIFAEEQKTQAQQVSQRIIAAAREDSYEYKFKNKGLH
jgi:hypothetical protein